MIIAIDGPAGAGKGTLAKALAERFDYAYLDTGALYRATALSVLESGGNPEDEVKAAEAARTLDLTILTSEKLRTGEVGAKASVVAKIPAVRAALLDFQRDFATKPPQGKAGAVLDGRDVGTVVVPEAPVKLFITASDEVRAQRRTEELRQKGESSIYTRVLADLRERDARDAGRADAPMRKADDAVEIDTSDLTVDQVLQAALSVIAEKQG